MADYDRYRDEDRYASRGDYRDRARSEGGRYETDYDRDRSGSRDTSRSDDGFGRGSRDYGESRSTYGRGSYGEDRGGYGRSGYGENRDYGGYGERGNPQTTPRFGANQMEQDWRNAASRSSSSEAFGRDYGGRDYREGDYGRRYENRDERGFFDRAGDEVASWFGDEDAERRRRMDSREDERSGQHRGRGPKAYQRSDDRIRDDVNDRLTDDSWLDASEIDVAVSGREVTLSGTVRNRSDKRRAEDVAEAVSGVSHVQNNLRVQTQTGETSWAGNRGTSGTTGAAGTTTDTTTTGTAGRRTTARADTAKS